MNKKFIRVLGLGVGLFLAGSLSVNAQKVSFNGERLSLKQAFEKIESVSKYKIAYNTSQLDVNKQVVLNQKNQDVLQILSDLLKGTNCVYQVNDNYIVITLKDDEKVKKIKGTIKDSAGEPIIGANVILKGDATVGSITDIDGNFDLSVQLQAAGEIHGGVKSCFQAYVDFRLCLGALLLFFCFQDRRGKKQCRYEQEIFLHLFFFLFFY